MASRWNSRISVILLFCFPELLLSAVVTLDSIEIYTTHEWLAPTPTVYFLCNGENKTVLPDVKKTKIVYKFRGEESFQPLTDFHSRKCKRCGIYEEDRIKSDDVFDEWEFCPSDFKTSDGRYIHTKGKEFNATFLCHECVKKDISTSSDYASPDDENEHGIHWSILIIGLSVVASFVLFILGLVVAYKYWQKRKRQKDQARFLKLFEETDDIEDELGTPHGWDVLFYIFQFFRVVLLFTVIILIGTGWSFLKPFLQEKEKKVLMIMIPLQVLANVASIVIGETGPFLKDWVTWNQVFLLVDIICCCAILFPIIWSIKSLRESSKTDGKAARTLAKLTLFRQFYVLVIGYLYFTRIIVFALKTIAEYNFQWVANAAEELASIVFYIVMFYIFRPIASNEYFIIDDEEEEIAEVVLNEEFEL